jgi:hypothetical protein
MADSGVVRFRKKSCLLFEQKIKKKYCRNNCKYAKWKILLSEINGNNANIKFQIKNHF